MATRRILDRFTRRLRSDLSQGVCGSVRAGVSLGVWDGTREGTKQGRSTVMTKASMRAMTPSTTKAFYAGIDYRLFGEFSISKYSLDYTRRSDTFTRQALIAAQAPEPGSVATVGRGWCR